MNGGKNRVEDYLAALPDEARTLMEELRQIIRGEVPEAEEIFSYGMPGFKYGGQRFLYYAAWKKHVALYGVSYPILERFAEELAGHLASKGTLQFGIGQPLPKPLLEKVIHARVQEMLKKIEKET